jgi:hypothetical protein
VHILEFIAKKGAQVNTRAEDISGRFQELEKSIKEKNTG